MRIKRSPFVAIIVLIIMIISVGGLYLYLLKHSNVLRSSTATNYLFKPKTSASATPDTRVASKLDGTLTTSDLAKRHPLGVMIENYPDARPQYGLTAASFVYEAIAEGGITRYLAIFGPNDAAKIGPIRSARTYYVDWCNEYDCYYSHVGGSYAATKEKIPEDKVKDLDQFYNASAYHREQRGDVAVEHTMFSSTEKLYNLANKKTWSSALRETYDIYSFFPELTNASSASPSASSTPSYKYIKVNFSTSTYDVRWDYSTEKNSYLRNLANQADKDANNDSQITAKNVIIQYIGRTTVTMGNGSTGYAMPTVGSGKADIYQGGIKISGTWSKGSKYERTKFFDENGKLISLYAGQTWIEIINPGSSATAY